jgi:hypothetical protein
MRLTLTAAVVLLALYTAPALADRDPQSGAPLPPKQRLKSDSPITDHFFIRGSWYGPTMRTDLRVDPSNPQPGQTGTAFNAENTLGLPDKLNKGRVEFMFRLRDRNKVRVDYFEADRTGNTTLDQNIVFNNTVFHAGVPTQSEFDWKQFDITYTYSFIRNNRFEVGTGLALYFLQIDALMVQTPPFERELRQEVSAATPFPALPLDLTWRVSSRWSATGRIAYLKAAVSGFHGFYADSHADLQYRVNGNFVLGAGYTQTRASLARSSGSFPGTVNLSISGPEAFIRFSF